MKSLKSIKTKLFFTLCIVILTIMLFLIVVNNMALETLYFYSKKKSLIDIYTYINEHYNKNIDIEVELEKIALSKDVDIIIRDTNGNIYVSSKDFYSAFEDIKDIRYNIKYNVFKGENIMYSDEKMNIIKAQDKDTGLNFILLTAKLDCRIYTIYKSCYISYKGKCSNSK